MSLLARYVVKDRLLAAHLDHALRATSAQEAERAVGMAKAMGIACVVDRIEVEKLAKERGKGLEEAARAARYGFLEKILDNWPGDYLVTAHQAEDQAETVLMKLTRGAGPGALVGIKEKSGQIVRPLLGFERVELIKYLEREGLEHMCDPSNLDERFSRNLVRLRILPVLEKLNPAFATAFGRAAGLAAAEEEFWELHLEGLMARLGFREDRGWYGVKAADLETLSLAEKRRVMGRLSRLVRLDRPGGGEPVALSGIGMILDFCGTPGAGGQDLPGGRRVEWRGQYVYVGPASRYNTKSST
jgi:tRNA(Ile)-lysidine synthase